MIRAAVSEIQHILLAKLLAKGYKIINVEVIIIWEINKWTIMTHIGISNKVICIPMNYMLLLSYYFPTIR